MMQQYCIGKDGGGGNYMVCLEKGETDNGGEVYTVVVVVVVVVVVMIFYG